MRKLTQVIGKAHSLSDADIDTDIIYPARFLLITAKKGLGAYAFADRRTDPDFPIRKDNERPILIAGPNFGCGSSREQAPWALGDLGIRVIIAISFGEIFHSNCLRNGILPIRLDGSMVEALRSHAEAGDNIAVDLAARTVKADNLAPFPFDVADDAREALLKGWNDTTRILALHNAHIAAFEAAQQKTAPWLWTRK